MKLPSLKVSIPLIFLIWCVVGVQVHGAVMLAYPAMWAAVGLLFLVIHLLLRAPAAPDGVSEKSPVEQKQAAQESNGSSADRKLYATA